MKYGRTTTNLLDMWGEPRFNSERVSQLFWGEPLKVIKSKSGFSYIRQIDAYEGWVDNRFIEMTGKDNYEKASDFNYVICKPTAKVYSEDKGNIFIPKFLYYGNPVRVSMVKDNTAYVKTSDRKRIYVKCRDIKPINKKRVNVTSRMIIAEAKKFIDIPYLWGGISYPGFDCSGFVRTILAQFGVSVPRDTKDQIRLGEAIGRDRGQRG